MKASADLFGEVLTAIGDGPRVSEQGGITSALMRRLHEKGMTLTEMSGPRIMARSKRTMQAHARELGLVFDDYVPMALRKKVVLQQFGDFFECIGDDAEPVAKALGIVVTTRRDGKRLCGVPAHALADCRAKLKAAWFVVKVVKAKKPRAKRRAS